MTKTNDPLHLRIEYKNALISKKEILTLELLLIKLAQTRKKYHIIKLKEIEIKEKIKRRINETKSDINSIFNDLPEFKIPKDIQKKREIKIKEKNIEEKVFYNKNLDTQLLEIQNKLNNLEEKLNRLR